MAAATVRAKPCWQWDAEGTCDREDCKFEHKGECWSERDHDGECQRGDECRFRHRNKGSTGNPPAKADGGRKGGARRVEEELQEEDTSDGEAYLSEYEDGEF